MLKPKLLGLSGSLRKQATNRLLLREAARLFGPSTYTEADLKLPLFDADLQNSDGIPEAVNLLANQIMEADGVLISTPEYNKSISGVLKNALDWVSRTDSKPWFNKPVVLMSAAAGRSGGERAQSALRLCMVPFRPRMVAGPEFMLAGSGKAFDESGRLENERSLKSLSELVAVLRSEIEHQ